MYEIVTKETVAPNIIYMKFKAPKIASTARPGQFVIIRVDEKGERIPMGLAGWDEKEGTVDIVFYVLGTSTAKLSTMKEGECVANIAGPLGTPTEIENFGRVICACGCFGAGPTLPLIKALKEKGNYVITVVEGRGPDFIFWVDKLKEYSDEVHVVTGCGKTAWANDFIEQELAVGKEDRQDLCPRLSLHDEGLLGCLPGRRSGDGGQPHTPHGGRHGHVRCLPGGGGRQDQVRLRGRPGFCRPCRQLGRTGFAPAPAYS